MGASHLRSTFNANMGMANSPDTINRMNFNPVTHDTWLISVQGFVVAHIKNFGKVITRDPVGSSAAIAGLLRDVVVGRQLDGEDAAITSLKDLQTG